LSHLYLTQYSGRSKVSLLFFELTQELPAVNLIFNVIVGCFRMINLADYCSSY